MCSRRVVGPGRLYPADTTGIQIATVGRLVHAGHGRTKRRRRNCPTPDPRPRPRQRQRPRQRPRQRRRQRRQTQPILSQPSVRNCLKMLCVCFFFRSPYFLVFCFIFGGCCCPTDREEAEGREGGGARRSAPVLSILFISCQS